jgi:hypothetical protein
MSTEQRDVRAIGVVHALQDLLSSAVLLVGEQRYATDERVVLDEVAYLHAQIGVALGGPHVVASAIDAAIGELPDLDLDLDSLEFAVILSSGYLRILEFRHRMPLSELSSVPSPLVLTSGQRPDALRAWRSGCTIELSVHLSTERPKRPLKPWRLGSWVARTEWSVATESSFTGFTPKPLTAEMKHELMLSSKAMRYVRVGSPPLEQDVTEESVELWLDADLLSKISANPRTKVAIALQRQLFVDAVWAVVTAARLAEGFDLLTWSDAEKSLIGRVVSLVVPNRSGAAARQKAGNEYLAMIRDDPARFMTFVEEVALMIGAYEAGLDG